MKKRMLSGRESEKGRKVNKVIAVLFLFATLLSLLCGCWKEAEIVFENGDGNGQNEQLYEQGIAMGRYMEEATNMSDEYLQAGMFQLADGNLAIAAAWKPLLISKNNGASWEEDNSMSGIWENKTYIFDIAIGADNTIVIVYDDYENNHEQDENSWIQREELHSRLWLIKPDGTEISIDVPITEEDEYLLGAWISDTGRIFVNTLGSNIYEVWEDGSSELFLALDPGCYPCLIQCYQNLMVIDGGNNKDIVIFDMEKKEYIEDEVLDEFVSKNYGDRENSIGIYDMYFFLDEEGVLYLAGQKGLHRHVIGGNVMEQVIDGNLTSFHDPSNKVNAMIKLENNDFITLFNGIGAVRYVYDPDIPTVPNEKLKVYGLQENDTIHQAISLYQITNPAVLVEYEIGMEDESSVTREDALKKLNTKIMAGEGPDVLILDDMPLDSYIKKGLLLDISPILDNLSGEDAIFTNIADAMKTGDKLYAMPLEIQIPVMYGEKRYTSRADNLESIADIVEELRKENMKPDKDLLGIFTERGIMYLFSMVSTPAWTMENGEIDMEAITEFLIQSKRIYDAQMDGLTEGVFELRSRHALWGQDAVYTDRTTTDVMSYLFGETNMVFGTVYTDYGYAQMDSVSRVENFENCEWISMNGQSSNVFVAETIVGINAASESINKAEEFIGACLGKKNQSCLFNGYPVNQAAFDEIFIYDKDALYQDGSCGEIRVPNGEGLLYSLSVYWPDAAQIAKLKNYIATVDTPYIEDSLLEETVYEAGIDYMQGNISLEEAVSEIEKKVSIIMAE